MDKVGSRLRSFGNTVGNTVKYKPSSKHDFGDSNLGNLTTLENQDRSILENEIARTLERRVTMDFRRLTGTKTSARVAPKLSVLRHDSGLGFAKGSSKRTSQQHKTLSEGDNNSPILGEDAGDPHDDGVFKFRIVREASGTVYKYVIDWDNPYRRMWDVVIVCAVVYLCFTVPLQITFLDISFSSEFSVFLDVLFWIDICLNFRTGFIHDGVHVRDPVEIRHHYLKSWFFVDILASIPFELLIGDVEKTTRKSLKILKWLKIPKLLRVGRVFKYLKRSIRYYRIFTLACMTLLLVHLCGCFWMAIAGPCDYLDNEEILQDINEGFMIYSSVCTQSDIWNYYSLSLRMSFYLVFQVASNMNEYTSFVDHAIYSKLTDIIANATASNETLGRRLQEALGYDDLEARFDFTGAGFSEWSYFDAARSYQSHTMSKISIFGTLIGFAVIVNFIAEAVVFSMNRMQAYYAFYNKVDQIKAEMLALELPMDIRYRVSRYYDYLWISKKVGLNDPRTGILRDPDLSDPLRKEIALRVHGPLLSGLSIFRECSADCLYAIALRLKTLVFLPGDIVFHKGDVARELFFIRKGVIAVKFGEVDYFETSRGEGLYEKDAEIEHIQDEEYRADMTVEDDTMVKLMGVGCFFGEVALLTSMPRSCSVFSKTISEINTLSKSDFEDCMSEYPELSKDIAKQVLTMYPGLKDKVEQFLGTQPEEPPQENGPGIPERPGKFKMNHQGSKFFHNSVSSSSVDTSGGTEQVPAHMLKQIVQSTVQEVLREMKLQDFDTSTMASLGPANGTKHRKETLDEVETLHIRTQHRISTHTEHHLK